MPSRRTTGPRPSQIVNLSARIALKPYSPYAVAALVVCVLKAIGLVVDHTPLFFLGDSHGYINAAVDHWVPLERSFVYPLLIRILAVWPHSILTLVIAQSIAGAATAWILAFVLIRHLRVRPGIAVVFAALLAIEPGQLLYERMILTEAFALTAFASHILFGVMYVSRPRPRLILAVALAGIVAVSLRTVYIPIVIVDALALPFLAMFRLGSARRLAAHVAIALAATLVCHVAYRQWMGALTGFPPAYQYQDGFFLLCAWSPVVEPVDADDPRAAAAIAHMIEQRASVPWGIYARDALRWQKGWLIDELVTAYGDERAANLAARTAAMHALARDPVGTLELGPSLYADYWRIVGNGLGAIVMSEEGRDRPIPTDLVDRMASVFNFPNADRVPDEMTPIKRYHYITRGIVVLFLVAVVLCLAAALAARRDARAEALFILFVFAALLGTTCQFSTSPVFRYLHPFAFALASSAAVIADAVVRAVAARRTAASS